MKTLFDELISTAYEVLVILAFIWLAQQVYSYVLAL